MAPFVLQRIFKDRLTCSVIKYSQPMFTLKEIYHMTDVPSLSSRFYPLPLRIGSFSLKDNSKVVYKRATPPPTAVVFSSPLWDLSDRVVSHRR